MASGPYPQGSTEAAKQKLDGYRATIALFGGADPKTLATATAVVTPAYREGIEKALQELGMTGLVEVSV